MFNEIKNELLHLKDKVKEFSSDGKEKIEEWTGELERINKKKEEATSITPEQREELEERMKEVDSLIESTVDYDRDRE